MSPGAARAALGCLLLAATVSAGVVESSGGQQKRLTRFSWEDCTASHEPLGHLISASLPEPMMVPGDNSVSFTMNIKEDLVAPLRVKLDMSKDTFFGLINLPIPCIFNVGSCTYDDVCPMMADHWDETGECPGGIDPSIIDCHCPIMATGGDKSYDIDFNISPDTVSGLIAWLASGQYYIKAQISSAGREVGCIQAEIEVAQGR